MQALLLRLPQKNAFAISVTMRANVSQLDTLERNTKYSDNRVNA